jgi:hypothetical protein
MDKGLKTSINTFLILHADAACCHVQMLGVSEGASRMEGASTRFRGDLDALDTLSEHDATRWREAIM